MRIPPDTHPDIAAALRELRRDNDRLAREIETLRQQGFNLRGQRVGGASEAILPSDYVTLGQLERELGKVQAKPAAVRRLSTTGNGTPPPPPPPPGQILPQATHRINFGYYFPEYVQQGFDGWADVALTVNTYYCVVRSAYAATPTEGPSGWVPRMGAYIRRAYNAGKRLHVLFEYDHADVQPFINQILDELSTVWDRVFSIEIADEPRNPDRTYMDEIQFNILARDLKAKIAAKGLPLTSRSFSVSLSPDQCLVSAIVDSDEVERIGGNLYLDYPSSGDVTTEVAKLNTFIDDFLAYVPDGSTFGASAKDIHFTMQAYDRNGFYEDLPSLIALQSAYYLKAYSNARVRALYAFSYGREDPGGNFGATHYHQELRVPHRAIYDAIKHLD